MEQKMCDFSYLKCSLKDCGFSEETTQRYLQYASGRKTDGMLHLLNRQRRSLLDELHIVQRKVDAIDFIIRSLEEQE